MKKVVFGIDIGGTTIKCGLFYEDGTLIEKCEIPTRKEESGSHIIEDICERRKSMVTWIIRKQPAIHRFLIL